VKFEDELEAEIVMMPFEGLMLMKLIGLRDPEFKAFSKEYDMTVEVPGMHTCVTGTGKLN
jgi:hypothetical protein